MELEAGFGFVGFFFGRILVRCGMKHIHTCGADTMAFRTCGRGPGKTLTTSGRPRFLSRTPPKTDTLPPTNHMEVEHGPWKTVFPY